MFVSKIKSCWQGIVLKPLKIVERNSEVFIKEALKKTNPKSVLDIGCGDQVNRQFVKGKYVGLDYPSDTKERSLKSKKVDVWGDARALPFKNKSFDMVLATCVLEHIYEKEKVVSEAFRVLRNNGHFLLTVPQCYRTHEAPYDFFRFTKFGIEKLLRENGFQITKITPSNRNGFLTGWYIAVNSLSQGEVKWRRFRLGLLATMMHFLYLFNWNHIDSKNKEHPVDWFVLAKNYDHSQKIS